MTKIDFDVLAREVIQKLQRAEDIVLATSAGDKVTARTMCHVNDGLDVYFSTLHTSEKYRQMIANPNVAFVLGNMQLEAIAADCGHPNDSPAFGKLYAAKFPHLAGLYPPRDEDVVIKCTLTKVSLYKYMGTPSWEVLDVTERAAYRL